MSRATDLIKTTGIILIAKISTQLISFLMLPLYTAVLSSEEYGVIDLITTYSALAVPIIGLQLEMGVFRYLVDNRKNEKNKTILITNTLLTIIVSVLLFSFVYLAIAYAINLQFTLLILTSTVTMLFSGYLLQTARGLGDNIGYAIGSILTGFSTIAINIILLLIFNLSINGVLIATTISNLICIIFLTFREKIPHYIQIKSYDKKEIAKILKYSLPLIPNSLIWWVINVSDRTIISIYLNMSANGIYAVSNKFSHIINAVYGVFNLSWTESASLHINDSDRDSFFSKTFNTTIMVFTSISLLILAFMPIVFKIMVGNGFDESYIYIPILAIGMIFNIVVSFIGAIYIAKKKTREVATTSLWSGILNIGINIILIKSIGIWAAALSTLLAFLIMSFYRYHDVQKYVKLKINKKSVVILLILTSICTILYYIHTLPTALINIIITITATTLLNKGLIKVATKALKAKFLN